MSSPLVPSDQRPLRDDAQAIFRSGVGGVLGDVLVRQAVVLDDHFLHLVDESIDRRSIDRIVVVGAGKASGAMAVGLAEALSAAHWPIVGWVNVPTGCECHAARLKELGSDVDLFVSRTSSINEPTDLAVEGTREILKLVGSMGPRDLCIALISGGGSALLCQPAGEVTLYDKQKVVRLLTAAGAGITQINTVRKQLSDVKAGGLARACRAGQMVALVLSDVLGDRLDVIASGPTVPDSSSPDDATEVLRQFDSQHRIPERVVEHLRQKSLFDDCETTAFPHDRVRTYVIGNNAVAVDAAGICAESLGYNHIMSAATRPEDSADAEGRRLADFTVGLLRNNDSETMRHDAYLSGGEPVVKLVDEDVRGRGGRNQQLILAAYARLLELGLSDDEWSRLVLMSAGTDGEDGPTDAAGALVDGEVHGRAIEQFLTPEPFLYRNDAYEFFRLTGGLVKTGPTGTNVCDLRVGLIRIDAESRL